MTGEQFEEGFIRSCKAMEITQTLPQDKYSPAFLWARDSTHHIATIYCGCGDAKVIRGGRDTYTVCKAHGVQPIGKARRMRTNWKYAQESAS